MPASHTITVYDVQLSHPERDIDPPPYFHSSPLEILRADLKLVLRHAAEIPYIFVPLPGRRNTQKDITVTGLLMQVVFFLVSLVVTGVLGWTLFVGIPMPWLALLLLVIVILLIGRVQGSPDPQPEDDYQDEAWLL